MNGSLLQLVARGAEDKYIINNPDITFFKQVYRRHTNFSRGEFDIQFNGTPNFGKVIKLKIPKYGDLLHRLFLTIDLPKITTYNKQLLIKNVQLKLQKHNITWSTDKSPCDALTPEDIQQITQLINDAIILNTSQRSLSHIPSPSPHNKQILNSKIIKQLLFNTLLKEVTSNNPNLIFLHYYSKHHNLSLLSKYQNTDAYKFVKNSNNNPTILTIQNRLLSQPTPITTNPKFIFYKKFEQKFTNDFVNISQLNTNLPELQDNFTPNQQTTKLHNQNRDVFRSPLLTQHFDNKSLWTNITKLHNIPILTISNILTTLNTQHIISPSLNTRLNALKNTLINTINPLINTPNNQLTETTLQEFKSNPIDKILIAIINLTKINLLTPINYILREYTNLIQQENLPTTTTIQLINTINKFSSTLSTTTNHLTSHQLISSIWNHIISQITNNYNIFTNTTPNTTSNHITLTNEIKKYNNNVKILSVKNIILDKYLFYEDKNIVLDELFYILNNNTQYTHLDTTILKNILIDTSDYVTVNHTHFIPTSITIYDENNFHNYITTRSIQHANTLTDLQTLLDYVQSLSQDNCQTAWIKKIGHYIIDHISITIGGQCITQHTGEWLNIWHELTKKGSKEPGYKKLIGDIDILTTYSSTNKPSYRLVVPLQFWFCKFIGNSLPLIAMQYSDVAIELKLKSFNDVLNYNHDTCGFKNTPKLSCSLLAEYIYLEEEERAMMVKSKMEYLIDTVYYVGDVIKSAGDLYNNTFVSEKMYLAHNIKELVWVFQDQSLIEGDNKEWDNYSVLGKNPTHAAEILFANRVRERLKEIIFYNYIEPLEHHLSSPSVGIQNYSFALSPEYFQPSGSANFSKIDGVTIALKLNEDIALSMRESGKRFRFGIYAVGHNVLRFMSGLAGLAFHGR